MPGGPGLTGRDIREGIEQADDVMHDVQKDIRTLAKDVRWQGLTGADRDEFFNGMTQEEWDTMHTVGTALGAKGENKLESLLREMVNMRKE